MKYIFTAILTLGMLANVAHAGENYRVNGFVEHYFTTKTTQHREANRTCQEVDVPIYQNNGKAQTGEVLGGAVIGGILGNQVGGGSGKDIATLLGAILGADYANKKGGTGKTIVGYKRTTVCEDTPTYSTKTERVYSHSTIRFTGANGRIQSLRFNRNQ